MSGRLSRQTIVVTGAARGLGRAVARGFLREGATVIACDRLEIAGLEGAEIQELDLADRESCRDFVRLVLDAHPHVDALVNNAAVLPFTPIEHVTDREWDETIAINLTAAFVLLRGFLAPMREHGGSIINVSSRAGVLGFDNEVTYCVTKFALEGLTRALAAELSEEPVSVNTVTPGLRIKPTMMTDEEEKRLAPSERNWHAPDAIVPAFVYLARARGNPTGKRFDAKRLADALAEEAFSLTDERLEELAE